MIDGIVKKYINEFKRLKDSTNEKPIKGIKRKLIKKIKELKKSSGDKIYDIYRFNDTWRIKFDDNPGISLDADDWANEIFVYFYEQPAHVDINVVSLGTNKQIKTDRNLWSTKKINIKNEEDIEKIIKFIKQQAKKHFKVNL